MFQDYHIDGHDITDFMGSGPQASPYKDKDMSSFGDFYSGGDPMAHGVPYQPPPLSMCKLGDGDFYAEQDDVYRGIAMGQAPGLPGLDGMHKALGEDIYGSPSDTSAFSYVGPALPTEKFHVGDVPPDQPKSSHFHFEATTVFIAVDAPYLLGNGVLDFLGTNIVASVSKINCKKFAIKANCFLDHIMCSLKVRVWKMPEGEFAVEFQRRQGDPFAFGDVYSQACQFLKQRFPTMRGPSHLPQWLRAPPPLPEAEGCLLTEADLGALLEMAKMETFPTLQAEAASSLAKMSCEETSALQILQTKETLDILQKLLGAAEIDIAYSASRVISELSKHEVEGRLVQHGILVAAISMCGAADTAQIVRLELSKAASESVRRCAVDMLSPEVTQGLSQALEEAMKKLGQEPSTFTVRNSLQDIYWELMQYGSPVAN